MSASTITAPKRRTTRKAVQRASSSRGAAVRSDDAGRSIQSKAGRIRLRGPRTRVRA